jgi:DNA-binding MarR family transcriptional regulator
MTRDYVPYEDRRSVISHYIVWFTRRHGYPPAAHEIAGYLGVSRPHVHSLLDRMEADGLIERQRAPSGQQVGRGIRVIRATTTAPTEET